MYISYFTYIINCEVENIDCMSLGKCQTLTFTRTIMRMEARTFLTSVAVQLHSGSSFRQPLDAQEV